MTTFIGDHTCKIDAKGRVMLPSAFKKHLPPASQDRFVLKKDIYEQCLVLYPWDEWERLNNIIRKNTNPYNKEHNRFLRAFFKGTAEIILDATNRLLIPKRLLEVVEIRKEVVLAGQFGKIEVWAKEIYENAAPGNEEFAQLAEKILGGTLNNDGDVS